MPCCTVYVLVLDQPTVGEIATVKRRNFNSATSRSVLNISSQMYIVQ